MNCIKECKIECNIKLKSLKNTLKRPQIRSLYDFFFNCLFPLQKVSEKVGGAEGTKLDEDFTEMEKARRHIKLTFSSALSVFRCSHQYSSPDSGWTPPRGQCWILLPRPPSICSQTQVNKYFCICGRKSSSVFSFVTLTCY